MAEAIDSSAGVNASWMHSWPTPSDVIHGEPIPWGKQLIRGDRLIWGDRVAWRDLLVWGNLADRRHVSRGTDAAGISRERCHSINLGLSEKPLWRSQYRS